MCDTVSPFSCAGVADAVQGLKVTNFGQDLQDGLVLGALLAAFWPGKHGRHQCVKYGNCGACNSVHDDHRS